MIHARAPTTSLSLSRDSSEYLLNLRRRVTLYSAISRKLNRNPDMHLEVLDWTSPDIDLDAPPNTL